MTCSLFLLTFAASKHTYDEKEQKMFLNNPSTMLVDNNGM